MLCALAGQRSPICRLSPGRCWPAGPCHRTGRCSSGREVGSGQREVAGSVLGTQAILRCRMCEGLGCDRVFFPSYVKQQHRPRGDCNLAIVQNLEIKLLFVKREKKSIQPCGGGKMALVKGRHPLWKGRARAQKASCVQSHEPSAVARPGATGTPLPLRDTAPGRGLQSLSPRSEKAELTTKPHPQLQGLREEPHP